MKNRAAVLLKKGRTSKVLTSCQYCGRIHEKKYICDKKRKAQEERWKKKRETKAFRFRKSYEWTQKSREIRERDHYMCLCCQAGLEKTYKKFTTEELDVHHIIPIEEDFNLRLSDDNLITICKVHHEMCEAGIISREQQMSLLSKTSEDVGFLVQ